MLLLLLSRICTLQQKVNETNVVCDAFFRTIREAGTLVVLQLCQEYFSPPN